MLKYIYEHLYISRKNLCFDQKNPFAPIVPCHRVVASNGALTGYSGAGGVTTKEKMLKEEGVFFKGKKVNLLKSGWKI